MMLATLVLSAAVLASILTRSVDGAAMNVQSCSKSESTSDGAVLATAYAPSLIVCSVMCRENRDCKTFMFANGICTMYWKNTDQTAPGAPNAPGTCAISSRIGCPSTIDGGKYLCTFSNTIRLCLCISSAAMQFLDAENSCKSYAMKLVAVQTAAKNTFIKNYLDTQNATFTLAATNSNNMVRSACAWTSGVRKIAGVRSFVWSSTQTAVDLSINDSSYLGNTAVNLIYSSITPEGKWRWDDAATDEWCNVLCEFIPT